MARGIENKLKRTKEWRIVIRASVLDYARPYAALRGRWVRYTFSTVAGPLMAS